MMIWLLAVAVLLMVVVVSIFAGFRKRLQILQKQVNQLQKEQDEILRDHPALVTADLFFAKQLKELNMQLVSMDNQLQSIATMRDNDGGYQHALKILEMGGDKKEILESCHLSNAEAELLMNLQAYRQALKA